MKTEIYLDALAMAIELQREAADVAYQVLKGLQGEDAVFAAQLAASCAFGRAQNLESLLNQIKED